MLLLPCRIGAGQNRPGLAQPELQLPEQSLALAHAQLDVIGFLNPGRERLAIPKVDPHPRVAGLLPQHPINLPDVLLLQSAGPPGTIPFRQTGQPSFIEMVHPIFHRPRCVAQKPRYFRTGHALGNQ